MGLSEEQSRGAQRFTLGWTTTERDVAALAAALPELPHACGLATAALLTGDVTAEPLHATGGIIAAVRPEPTEEQLVRHAAGPELTARWQARLAECSAQL